jgi:hypothetical protein
MLGPILLLAVLTVHGVWAFPEFSFNLTRIPSLAASGIDAIDEGRTAARLALWQRANRDHKEGPARLAPGRGPKGSTIAVQQLEFVALVPPLPRQGLDHLARAVPP